MFRVKYIAYRKFAGIFTRIIVPQIESKAAYRYAAAGLPSIQQSFAFNTVILKVKQSGNIFRQSGQMPRT